VGVAGCAEGPLDSSSANGTPTAADAAFTVTEDGVLGGRLTARDPDGDALQLVVVAAPRSGTLELTADRFLYRPDPNFHGQDELTFTASDGRLTSATARVTFSVTAADDGPQLGANLFSGPSGFRIAGQLAASDLDGDPLTFSMPSPTSGTLIELDAATGRFIFEPLPALAGAEIIPMAVVSNGKVALGQVTFQLDAVSFTGTWQASDVRLDGTHCADFALPIQSGPAGVVRILQHEVTCGAEQTTYEPLQLHRDADSPSSLHASQYLEVAPGAFLHVAIAVEPIPSRPSTYRYVETLSGAFDQVTTAILTRA
jgi:Bacterial Ig domain